ncbi:hypothetical protein ABEF95_016732 [Exophiala dermatitidis]
MNLNSSATTFFRACRGATAASRVPVPVPQPTRSSIEAGVVLLRPRGGYQQQRGLQALSTHKKRQYQHQQICQFSSRNNTPLHNAQPVNDIPSAATASSSSTSVEEDKNLGQTVLLRGSTEASTTTSSSTSSNSSYPTSTTSTTTTTTSSSSSSSTLAPAPNSASAESSASASFILTGHVTRTGTMRKTVRVTRTIQVYDKFLRKYWKKTAHDLVHDPQDILNEGDVITYGPFPADMRAEREQKGKLGGNRQVKFVLKDIITPFGVPVEARTPRQVGSPEGRWIGTPGQQVQVQVSNKHRAGAAKAKGKQKA